MLRSVVRRAGALAAGTGFGQLFVLLVTPVVARLYTPAQFGALALLMTVTNISTAIACMRYDFALPSAPEEDVHGLLETCIISASLIASVAALATVLFSSTHWLHAFAGVHLLPLLIGLAVLLAGLYQATGSLILRRSRYRALSVVRMSQGAAFAALAPVPVIGLLWAQVASFGSGLIAIGAALRGRLPGSLDWRRVAKAYWRFPALSLPGAVLDVVGYSLCVWIISSSYGPASVGQYSQVQRLIGAPLMLASMSLSQVLLRQTAELNDAPAAMRLLVLRVFGGLLAAALAGLVVIVIFGEPLFRLLLGSQWHVEAEFLTAVCIAVSARICVSPISVVLITKRRFRLTLSWQILYFFSAATVLSFFAHRVPFDTFVQIYAVHEVVLYGVYFFLISIALRS